jgi:NTE family protein
MASAAARAQTAPRLKIGLALGGGGARGGAHLGVLEVLEELRVPWIASPAPASGPSSAGRMRRASRRRNQAARARDGLGRIFDDSAGRASLNLRRKEIEERFFSGLEIGVSREGQRFREGAVTGEKLKLFFNRLVRAELGSRPIEELPLPLAVIAHRHRQRGTGGDAFGQPHLGHAREHVGARVHHARRSRGAQARRRGPHDNLPSRKSAILCADVVIAVNVGSPLFTPDQVTGVVTVLGQVVNLLTEQNVIKSKELISPSDFLIVPEMKDIGSTQFTRQLEAAEFGRQATLEIAADLSGSRCRKRHTRHGASAFARQGATAARDRRGGDRRDPFRQSAQDRRGIRQEEGKPLDLKTLTEDLVTEYSQGDLQSLDYSVLAERERTILRITPIEKPWGPDYLSFGLNLSSDFRSESSYNLRALYRKTWMNSLGGEWLTRGQIGSVQSIASEFYQPFDSRQRYFVRPYVRHVAAQGEPVFRRRSPRGLSRAGKRGRNRRRREPGRLRQARLGWVERRIGSVLDTGPDIFSNVTERVRGAKAALSIDTYDEPFFRLAA